VPQSQLRGKCQPSLCCARRWHSYQCHDHSQRIASDNPQRFLQLLVIHGDGTIALTTGDTLRLLEDAQVIKPTFMAGVPRVFNRYVGE
jgi:hypothetical protein